jgi:pimeloyl-ACP methyl ester carboxylesterase
MLAFWKPAIFAFCLSCSAAAAVFPLSVESGRRTTFTGEAVNFDLYVPQVAAGQRVPAVLLIHGFARSKAQHEVNARYLAERGMVVMTPNLTSTLGEDGQYRNALNMVDLLYWMLVRSFTPGDTLAGRIDPARFGLAGHSAGGAVAFEAATIAQSIGLQVRALNLLDAVPWTRTNALAPTLSPLGFSSLRSEPSACNANGSVTGLLGSLRFAAEDVRIAGATHCDPENPSDFLCRLVCGGGSSARQTTYQRLMYLFLRDTFAIPEVAGETQTYRGLLAALRASGAVR